MQNFQYGMAAFDRAAARGGEREARAALEAERSNDESAGEETFPRSSAGRVLPPPQLRAQALPQRRGAEYTAKAFAAGTEPSGGSRVQTGALKLRSASEKRPVNAMPPSACASRRKPAFGAAAHRSQKIGGAKALLRIGGAEPEHEERRGDTQTDAGAPFPERHGTAGSNGRTPKAPARGNGEAGTRKSPASA